MVKKVESYNSSCCMCVDGQTELIGANVTSRGCHCVLLAADTEAEL